ncbi:hypothetical protein GUJ93_ZPchr0004g39336 [Zizania palustris]|uniref:Uncharacterized protein n=1 Tax=Zizania palustris TaxID=103762 RepID=A0A8J5SJW0_ZIZPA|nr:hypothetical protein GUJ93_ZPchr0004g39336 [Zizania palustris]
MVVKDDELIVSHPHQHYAEGIMRSSSTASSWRHLYRYSVPHVYAHKLSEVDDVNACEFGGGNVVVHRRAR